MGNSMSENPNIPLHLAEMLHATLGPLYAQLHEEGHVWAPLVKSVLDEYTHRRHLALDGIYGADAPDMICRVLQAAAEEVCNMSDRPVQERDFAMWSSELGGETV